MRGTPRAARGLRARAALAAAPDRTFDRAARVGGHNTYQLDGKVLDPFRFAARVGELYGQGVRGIELDLVQDPARSEWSVGHWDFEYSPLPARQFSAFLGALMQWSSENDGHDLVVVHLEPKAGADPTFVLDFDSYILRSFDPALLFRPGDLLQPGETLADAVTNRGWPTLGAMRGRFLFCMTGDADTTRVYASTAPPERLCFADRGISQTPGDGSPFRDRNRIFLNIEKTGTRWQEILDEEVAAQAWVLPRLYGGRNAGDWGAVSAQGNWMLSVNAFAGADAADPYRDRGSRPVARSLARRAAPKRRTSAGKGAKKARKESAASKRRSGPARPSSKRATRSTRKRVTRRTKPGRARRATAGRSRGARKGRARGRRARRV